MMIAVGILFVLLMVGLYMNGQQVSRNEFFAEAFCVERGFVTFEDYEVGFWGDVNMVVCTNDIHRFRDVGGV